MDAALWPSVLSKLIGGEDLSADEATSAMSAILEGTATPAQIAGFVVALRVKGETAAEMAALVRTMLAFADVVRQGKALYIGVSEWTADEITRGAALARELKVPFISNQPQYNAIWRVIESQVVPASEIKTK